VVVVGGGAGRKVNPCSGLATALFGFTVRMLARGPGREGSCAAKHGSTPGLQDGSGFGFKLQLAGIGRCSESSRLGCRLSELLTGDSESTVALLAL
jgi:hypothetical protein